MKRTLWRMALIGLVVISLTPPSYAGDQGLGWDYKSQPGAACQPQIGAQAGDFERYPHSILNISDTGRTVICPIIRDSVSQTDLDIGVVVSRTTGEAGEGGVSCTFFSMNTYGDPIGAPHQPSQVVPEDPANPQASDREIQYFSVKADQTAFDGSYAIQCTLQPSAQVYRYNAGEYAISTDYGE